MKLTEYEQRLLVALAEACGDRMLRLSIELGEDVTVVETQGVDGARRADRGLPSLGYGRDQVMIARLRDIGAPVPER